MHKNAIFLNKIIQTLLGKGHNCIARPNTYPSAPYFKILDLPLSTVLIHTIHLCVCARAEIRSYQSWKSKHVTQRHHSVRICQNNQINCTSRNCFSKLSDHISVYGTRLLWLELICSDLHHKQFLGSAVNWSPVLRQSTQLCCALVCHKN